MAERGRKKRLRPVRIVDGVAYIPLTKGKEAMVDVADLHLINNHNWVLWTPSPTVPSLQYAGRKHSERGVKRTVKMHRVLMGAKRGQIVDHINGDGLDNRRKNLRISSPRENARNLPAHRNGKTVGVYHDKRRGVYEARLILGRYKSEREAVRAIQIAEKAISLPIDV